MRSWLASFGRARALTAGTAAVILLAAVGGYVAKDGDSPLTVASDVGAGEAAPSESFDPLASLSPALSEGTGEPEVVARPSATAGARSGAPQPSAGRVRGPAEGTPVRVGVHFNDNEGAAAQFGVGGLPNISDAEVKAVIAQVNRAGGLAGRPISPVLHRTDPLSGTFDSQGQAACETFTDDNDVSFVIDNALSPSTVLADCLAKRKIPLVWELHMSQVTNATMARYEGYLYRPSMPNADRLDFVVDALHKDGFFKGAKVGIVRYDTPEHDFISDKVFRPRLAALGIDVVAEHAMTKPANSGGAAGLAGQSSNAVLDFKEAGVTHVLYVPTGGAIPLTFIPSAASQGYEPAYGLSSQDAPDFVGQNFPESQLRKAKVVGWAPELDGDDIALGAALERCKRALADAGLPWDYDIQSYCDAFYLLHEALYDEDGVSAAGLKRGVEALGTSFDSPYIFGTRFGKGRYDGPTKARMLRYDASKQGWRYYGSTFDIG